MNPQDEEEIAIIKNQHKKLGWTPQGDRPLTLALTQFVPPFW